MLKQLGFNPRVVISQQTVGIHWGTLLSPPLQINMGAEAVEVSYVSLSWHNLAFIHLITATPVLLKLADALGTSHTYPTCLPHCQGLNSLWEEQNSFLASKRIKPRGQHMEGHWSPIHLPPGQALSEVQQFFRETTMKPPNTRQPVSGIHFTCDLGKVCFQGMRKGINCSHAHTYFYMYIHTHTFVESLQPSKTWGQNKLVFSRRTTLSWV